ncbi:hypothetical protein [uncultured Bifidobacterium sp.]|uniref:hypothetical protein n=1 Tax=uncultured Bifidobacterium sp. TaxID=165187 RepID=UPI002584A987|nr:hypothetical protein [uncultured Bifidobacterium sp.]
MSRSRTVLSFHRSAPSVRFVKPVPIGLSRQFPSVSRQPSVRPITRAINGCHSIGTPANQP